MPSRRASFPSLDGTIGLPLYSYLLHISRKVGYVRLSLHWQDSIPAGGSPYRMGFEPTGLRQLISSAALSLPIPKLQAYPWRHITHCSLPFTHHSLLIARCFFFVAYCSLFIFFPCLLLSAYCFLLLTRYSSLIAHCFSSLTPDTRTPKWSFFSLVIKFIEKILV